MFATIDGTEPSLGRYNFVGPPPLSFKISKSLCVKAVAVSDKNIPSVAVLENFTRLEVSGIGALLGKMSGLKVCMLLSPPPMCVVLRISLDVIRFPALNLFSCLQGIYVQDIVTGGSVWKNGIIQVFAG